MKTLCLISCIFLVFVSSCANAQSPMLLPVHGDKLHIMRAQSEITAFEVEIATTEEQRSAGLMFRTDLPRDRGMLFVFEDESERFFWMQNTPTPLDIIYADANGKIVHVAIQTTPFSTMPIPSKFPAKFAFEVHAGISSTFNIVPGDQLKHSVIEKK